MINKNPPDNTKIRFGHNTYMNVNFIIRVDTLHTEQRYNYFRAWLCKEYYMYASSADESNTMSNLTRMKHYNMSMQQICLFDSVNILCYSGE